jgi:hypothetical protein
LVPEDVVQEAGAEAAVALEAAEVVEATAETEAFASEALPDATETCGYSAFATAKDRLTSTGVPPGRISFESSEVQDARKVAANTKYSNF